jgi:hypothetical protein
VSRDGHIAAFAVLGGVPLSILYGNTTLDVAKKPPRHHREHATARYIQAA